MVLIPGGDDRRSQRIGPKVFADVPTANAVAEIKRSRARLLMWVVLLLGFLVVSISVNAFFLSRFGGGGSPDGPAGPNGPDSEVSDLITDRQENEVYTPVGHILAHNASIVAVGGGYATLLLTRTGRRNGAACQVFLSALSVTFAAPNPRPELVDGALVYRRPVYWPSTTTTGQVVSKRCDTLLPLYDHDRADILLARIGRPTGEGPYLVIWREDQTQAGVFDFSNVPADEFSRHLSIFIHYMSQQEDVWDPRFYREANIRQRWRRFFVEEADSVTRVAGALLAPEAQAEEPRQ